AGGRHRRRRRPTPRRASRPMTWRCGSGRPRRAWAPTPWVRRQSRRQSLLRLGGLELVPRPRDLEQLLHALAGLGALLQPVDGLLVVDRDGRRLTPRVIGPDDLDESTISG